MMKALQKDAENQKAIINKKGTTTSMVQAASMSPHLSMHATRGQMAGRGRHHSKAQAVSSFSFSFQVCRCPARRRDKFWFSRDSNSCTAGQTVYGTQALPPDEATPFFDTYVLKYAFPTIAVICRLDLYPPDLVSVAFFACSVSKRLILRIALCSFMACVLIRTMRMYQKERWKGTSYFHGEHPPRPTLLLPALSPASWEVPVHVFSLRSWRGYPLTLNDDMLVQGQDDRPSHCFQASSDGMQEEGRRRGVAEAHNGCGLSCPGASAMEGGGDARFPWVGFIRACGLWTSKFAESRIMHCVGFVCLCPLSLPFEIPSTIFFVHFRFNKAETRTHSLRYIYHSACIQDVTCLGPAPGRLTAAHEGRPPRPPTPPTPCSTPRGGLRGCPQPGG